MLPTFLSVGTLALTAHAFLLPLEVVQTAEVSESLAPFVRQSQEIDLDCSTCPFALESRTHDGIHEWTHSQKSDLKLKFSTAGNQVSLNGVPFYPAAATELPPALTVKQVAKKVEDGVANTAYSGDLSLSYSLAISEIKHFANPDEEEADLVSVVISILGLDGEMVQVDDIQMRLLKEANSALHIIDVFTVPSSRNDAQCTTVMCRFFAKIAANMGAAKSAAQSTAQKVGQKVRMCCLRCMNFFRGASHHHMHHNKHHGDKPHSHMSPNGGHHKSHGHHMSHELVSPEVSQAEDSQTEDSFGTMEDFMVGVQRGFAFSLSYIIFPILVGIVFGVTASAVGMLVGQLVVFLWSKFRPANEVAYVRVEDPDEKEEDLPAYDDMLEEVIKEKA